MNPLPASLLVVTDRHQARKPLEAIVGDVVQAGGRWIWLRDRDLAPSERRALACRLLAITRRSGACLSIGADAELAAEIEADGVHLPSTASVAAARGRLGPRALVGVSAHSVRDVEAASGVAADYVTLSPVFATSSKPGYGPPLGLEPIKHAARFGIPVLALGGITPNVVEPCCRHGAAGVAVMGAVMGSETPADVWRRLFLPF